MAHGFQKASAALFTAILVLAPSCSSDDDKPPKIRKVEGTAKDIDLKNNYVSMLFTNSKGEEMLLEGTVREDTEVWINGRSHALQDLREGEHVVVFGYREGEGLSEKLVATKIEVQRPESEDWQKPIAPTANEPAASKSPAASSPPGATAQRPESGGE